MKQIEVGTATTGYLIFSGISIMIFSLAFKDLNFLIFGIPILFAFVLAASIGKKGSTDSDLERVGWTTKKLNYAIPYGIAGGIISVFLGGLIMGKMGTASLMLIVPDFASIAALRTADIIPPSLALAANIIAQWMIVAPSEEALTKIIGPYAGLAVFKNIAIAYILSLFIWAAMHIATYMYQGATSSAYIVLAVIFAVSLGVMLITSNVMGAIITHGTFNTIILVIQNSNDYTIYAVALIFIILSMAWIKSTEGKA